MQKFNNISRKIKKYLNPDLSDLLTPIYLVELPAYLKNLPLELQALANKIYKDYKVNFKPCCKLNLASADIFKYYQILKMLIEDSKVKRIAFKKYTLREIFGNDIPLTTFQKLISYLYEPYKNCLLNVHGQELYHQDFNLPTYKFTYISSIIELSKMDFTDLEKNIFLCKSLNNYDLEEIKGLVSQLSLNLQRNIYFKFGPDLTENRKVGKFSDAKYLINIISDELKLSKHKNSSLKLTLKSF